MAITITETKKISQLVPATIINENSQFIIGQNNQTNSFTYKKLADSIESTIGLSACKNDINELKTTIDTTNTKLNTLTTTVQTISDKEDTVAGKGQLGKIALVNDESQLSRTQLPLKLTPGTNEAYIDASSIDTSSQNSKINSLSTQCIQIEEVLIDDDNALTNTKWNPVSKKYQLSSIQSELYNIRNQQIYVQNEFTSTSSYINNISSQLSIEINSSNLSIGSLNKNVNTNKTQITQLQEQVDGITFRSNTMCFNIDTQLYLNNTISTLSTLFLSAGYSEQTQISNLTMFLVKLSSENADDIIYNLDNLNLENNDKIMFLNTAYVQDITPKDLVVFKDVHVELSNINTSTNTLSIDVKKCETAETGYLTTYEIYQGGIKKGESINIPKDFLVKDAVISSCVEQDVPLKGLKPGDKYLDFTLNTKDSEEKHLYISLADIIDIYDGGNTTTISSSIKYSENDKKYLMYSNINSNSVSKALLATDTIEYITSLSTAAYSKAEGYIDGKTAELKTYYKKNVELTSQIGLRSHETILSNELTTLYNYQLNSGFNTPEQLSDYTLINIEVNQLQISVNNIISSIDLSEIDGICYIKNGFRITFNSISNQVSITPNEWLNSTANISCNIIYCKPSESVTIE